MTRDETIKKRVAEASELYRPIMLRAYEGKATKRDAIKAQCLICVGYVRDDITNCTGYSCPLWMFRPYQNQGGKAPRIDAGREDVPEDVQLTNAPDTPSSGRNGGGGT